ncbi:MAG TPA: ABC-2 family transporter protein [Xanthomonadales bacterium]|nr:ABC-2 family transporter protein [Xanthomonadales bacterium]
MRYVRIFFLNFQYLLAHRERPLIYVFTYVFNALIFLAFMRGVFASHNSLGGWTLSSVTSYYFLLIPAAGTLMTHPEIPIFRDDIEKGELASRLLKPFSYYWQRFYIEIPVRIFQSIVGTVFFFLLSIIFGNFLQLKFSPNQFLLVAMAIALAYMICFTFKMIVGITALWTTDIRGLHLLVDAIIVIFAGYIVPVNLLPGILEKIAYLSPFPYIIYFPVVAIQGKLSQPALISVIGFQIFWLILLGIFFHYQWKIGLRKFTNLGH